MLNLIFILSILWSDADSGYLSGIPLAKLLPFRIANHDAPETGGVGAFGGAVCEHERVLGYAAKEHAVKITKDKLISIAAQYGYDRYGRLVVDLSVSGSDYAEIMSNVGHMKEWPHVGGRAVSKKPSWCQNINHEN